MPGVYVVSLACWWSEAGTSGLEICCTLALLLLALLLFCCRALSLLLSGSLALLLSGSLALLLLCSFCSLVHVRDVMWCVCVCARE